MEEIIKEIKKKKFGKVIENASFRNLTTYKIGGTIALLCYPDDVKNLIKLLKFLKEKNVNYKILGKGSNIIPSDNKYEGVIIKLDNLNKIEVHPRHVIVGSGVSLMQLANQISKSGYTGLEFACGIPGTVGGAIYMNAGAYNKSMSDILMSVKVLDQDFDIIELSNRELEFGYRHSIFQKNKSYICIEAKLRILKGNKEVIKKLIDERRKRREETQPLNYPSAGSVFRNPPDLFAGKLIEDANLKGKKVGGAMVSDKHANFIINYRNANSKDIKNLIELIEKEVKNKYDVKLKVEQEFFNWE